MVSLFEKFPWRRHYYVSYLCRPLVLVSVVVPPVVLMAAGKTVSCRTCANICGQLCWTFSFIPFKKPLCLDLPVKVEARAAGFLPQPFAWWRGHNGLSAPSYPSLGQSFLSPSPSLFSPWPSRTWAFFTWARFFPQDIHPRVKKFTLPSPMCNLRRWLPPLRYQSKGWSCVAFFFPATLKSLSCSSSLSFFRAFLYFLARHPLVSPPFFEFTHTLARPGLALAI